MNMGCRASLNENKVCITEVSSYIPISIKDYPVILGGRYSFKWIRKDAFLYFNVADMIRRLEWKQLSFLHIIVHGMGVKMLAIITQYNSKNKLYNIPIVLLIVYPLKFWLNHFCSLNRILKYHNK